ncbi:MAG: 4'-phosphopantetheinyl transferase superfamily protein [Elusimicrobiales bacterium]|nr:4'-phosphopantetheinyl transferase superfamily protein [Elusimicrobiales bacterium]
MITDKAQAAEVLTQEWPGCGVSLKFLRVAGQVPGGALSRREADVYGAFRIEKRRSEWLAGRLAAKAALAGMGKPPAELEIGMDHLGRPCCAGALVSISHSNGWALAAFRPGSSFLGADLEKIESRHPAWYSDYFHPAELPQPDPSEGTRLWAIKEALMKALGLGLMADPLDIRVGERISFTGRTLERYRDLGSPEFSVEARPFPEGFWTAVAAGRAP